MIQTETLGAQEMLKEIKKLDRMIMNKLDELERWRSVSTSTTAMSTGERVQSSGGQQKMESAVIKCIEIQEDIKKSIEYMVIKKENVLKLIEELDADEYDLLYKMYFRYMTMRKASEAMGINRKTARIFHDRALEQIQRMIEEREKDG